MIMTLLFLLPTGCRKDDFNDQGETKKIQFASQNQKLAIYSPLFDTIPPNVGTRDKPEFKAISPKKKQLEEMVESFRQLNGSDPFIKDLITSIRSGYIPDFNYSTIHGKETDKGFIIFVPLIKNNKVDHVLRCTYSEGAFSFGLISRQKINQYIDSGTFESESLSHNFASINILNFYSFTTSSDIDKKLNDAVVNLSKKVKKPKGGRCEQIIIMEWWGYGLISVNGTTQPGYATSGEFEIRIPCSAGGSNTTQTITTNTETSSVTTTGGGYTSPTSLTSTLNLAVKTVLPYINNDCLDKMDNFTKTTITGIAQTISDPCGGPESIKNLITQIVVTKCNNSSSSSNTDPFSFTVALTQFEFGQEVRSTIQVALSSMDKIIEDPTFTNCANLKCVYKEIAKKNNSHWCSTIANFDNYANSDLIFQVGGGKNNVPSNYFSINPKIKGTTSINDKGQMVIAFNPTLCGSNAPLTTALTILHEGTHAEIWRYMKVHWPYGNWPANVNQSNSQETFKKLFVLSCTSTVLTNQHNLMLEQWIDQLTTGLWEFNGKQGTKEDYKYLAIQGIWDENDPCSTKLINLVDYSKLKEKFSKVTNYFNYSSCD